MPLCCRATPSWLPPQASCLRSHRGECRQPAAAIRPEIEQDAGLVGQLIHLDAIAKRQASKPASECLVGERPRHYGPRPLTHARKRLAQGAAARSARCDRESPVPPPGSAAWTFHRATRRWQRSETARSAVARAPKAGKPEAVRGCVARRSARTRGSIGALDQDRDPARWCTRHARGCPPRRSRYDGLRRLEIKFGAWA